MKFGLKNKEKDLERRILLDIQFSSEGHAMLCGRYERDLIENTFIICELFENDTVRLNLLGCAHLKLEIK